MPSLDESVEAFNLLFQLKAKDAELSAMELLEKPIKNKRISPRYVRDDIVVVLCEPASSFSSKEVFMGFVKLNDIASRGISFFSEQYLVSQKKIVLYFRFQTDRTFRINATVVYRLNTKPYQYGVKFDEENSELAEHLLETQKKLVLR